MRKTDLRPDPWGVIKSLPARRKEAKEALRKAVEALAERYPLSPKDRDALYAELSTIPRRFEIEEKQALTGSGGLSIRLDNDTAAVYQRMKHVTLQDLVAGKAIGLTNTKWEDLSRKERDAARKTRQRFESAPTGAFQKGRPPRFPKEIVFHYVAIIEKYTGESFGISRDMSVSNRATGPRFNLLMAALHHACISRKPPAVSTVEHILRHRHKP
jgi:hypothetical protein